MGPILGLRIRVLTAVAVLAATGTASAANWVPAGESIGEDGVPRKFFIDKASIVKKGAVRRVWLREEAEHPAAFTMPGQTSQFFRSSLVAFEYNCEHRETATRAIQMFSEPNTQGQKVFSHTIPGNLEFSPVSPDSMGERWMKIACSPR